MIPAGAGCRKEARCLARVRLTGIGFIWLGCLKSATPPLLTVQDKLRRALHTAHRLFRPDPM
jgi:hypothetical protein